MKKAESILIVLTVLSVFQSRADVSAVSPDGRNRIVLATDSLACTVERDGKVVVGRSALALETDRGTFAGGTAQVSSRSLCGELKTPVYKKASVSLAANETLADFGGYAVRLVARNDGVAWRFETKGEGEIEIRSERAGVTIPSAAEKALVYRNHLPGREEKIADVMRPDEIATDGKTFVYLPLVYSVGGTTVAVCESDVCDYPIWNLRRNAASGGTGFDGVFPPWPLKVSNNEGVLREDGARRQRNWCVQSEAGYLVRTPATRTYPWRVFLLADSPAKLCECDAVAALARPAADGADFSWVKPGKVAWDWWNAFDNIGDPEGCTTATYERFIDFAATNGVEYVIFDEGWSEKLDIWKFHPNVDVPHLVRYAEARGVGIILWMAWAQVQGEEARVAETFAGLGVKGFKVDFMDRGDAEAERFLWRFADECAKRYLLVDYHGAHRPTGMSRAYPNVVNYEGVHGLEQMKCYDPSRDMMANDVRTFFGRMTVGPLDYTPGAMDNYPLGKYPVMGKGDTPRKFRTFVNPGSLGTRCRQMAMMALYEAPLQMLADSPTKYEKNAESFAFMAKVPTVWDATLGLGGTPETHAAVARRARNGDWYVAAITDGVARRIEIDTSFLGLGDWRIEYFRDAADAAEHPSHYCHGTGCVRAGRLAVELAPGGGYVARLSRSAEADPLDARAAEENRHVVRELGVDGQAEIWNANACQFTYPPQFAFKAVEGAVKYRFVACDAHLVEQSFEADVPTAPLTPVWEKLAENGFVTVTADGIGADGKVCGRAGSRRFWKMPRFRPGTYEPPKRGYLEAANRIYDYVFELPSTQYFLETGKPDPDYGLNCYPAKMHGALVSAMVTYAKTRPDRAAAALKLARNAADYLISVSQPAGAPLAYFPPTYDNPKVGPGVGGVGPQGQGKNMLLYGVTAANAYLGLYGETKEANYLEQAKGIVETYLRLQGEDGTCPLKVDEKTGVPVNPNRAFPIDICALLERLHGLTGDARLLAAAERGLAFVRNGPMKNWNWEGQFEDIEPTAKFVNLTKHPPCSTALYLLKHDGKNPDVRAFAREVLRFTEDQFVCWEVPCDRYGFGPRSKPGVDPRMDSAGYWSWRAPSALEQYHCYQPIDSSAAKVIRTYLALWHETHDPLDLAKARALADVIVNEQFENGRVPTFWTECCRRDAKGDWINCMLAAASALVETAEAVAGPTAVFDVRDFGAKGDGIAKDTASVQRALDACAAAGGGRVVVPPGTYVIGSVFLGDGTDLHLEAGAVLLGSPDLADYNADDAYPQNHGSKHEGWSAKHLVLAVGKERVSITGCGTIDGNARAFFVDTPRWTGAICWRDGAINARDAERQGRPGQEIVFIESKDVAVRDVTLRDMACWSCFFHGCENVTVGGVTVRNDLRYLNTDGFDVDSCRNVSIGDCRITTGDDAIAIRGCPARLTDPARVCENIRVSNVVCRVSADGVRVGVGDGEIRNVRVSDMTILRAGRGLHVQSCYGANPKKGVDISDIVFSRIRIRDAVTPILIGAGSPNCKAQIRGIRFEDVDAEAMAPVTVVGGGIARPSGISFANLRFRVLPSSKPIPPDAEAGKLSDAEPAAFRLQGTGSVSFENSVLSWDPEVQAGFRKAFSVIDAEQPSVDVNSRIGVGHACDF